MDKKGFTLIEMIVGLAILAIVIGTAVYLIMPITNDYSSSSNKSAAQQIASSLINEIKQQTNNSTAVKLKTDSSGNEDPGTIQYTQGGTDYDITATSSGYLSIAGKQPYTADFYKGDTITISGVKNAEAEKTVDMTLTVLSGTRTLYTTTCTLQPTLLANNSASGGDGGSTSSATSFEKLLDQYNITASSWSGLMEEAVANNGASIYGGKIYYDYVTVNGQTEKHYGTYLNQTDYGPDYIAPGKAKNWPAIDDYAAHALNWIYVFSDTPVVHSVDEYNSSTTKWANSLSRGDLITADDGLYAFCGAYTVYYDEFPSGNFVKLY